MYKSVLSASFLWLMAQAHQRLIDPVPRSTQTGMNDATCGDDTYLSAGDWPMDPNEYTELTPGDYYDFQIEVVTNHEGASYRVALSNEEDDTYEDCFLIDHVPQVTDTNLETLTMRLMVPDVQCLKCAIQVIMIRPNDEMECCMYDEDATQCGQGYYSCANVRINGTTARDDLMCEPICDWDYRYQEPLMYFANDNQDQWEIDEGDSTMASLIMNVEYVDPVCGANEAAAQDCGEVIGYSTTDDESAAFRIFSVSGAILFTLFCLVFV